MLDNLFINFIVGLIIFEKLIRLKTKKIYIYISSHDRLSIIMLIRFNK